MQIERSSPTKVLSQITDQDSTLARLVLSGYDLTNQGLAEGLETVRYEYNFGNERTEIYLAREGSEVIGSLTLIKWFDTPDDKRGKLFFPKLRELDPSMALRLSAVGPLICDVAGVVVHPHFRGKGVARALLKQAIEELKPTIIQGQTKTVGAVALRSKLEGYRTFFAHNEVTATHPQENTEDHASLHEAFRYAREITQGLPEGWVHSYDGEIAPTIPDTSLYPPVISNAFLPLIAAQRRIGFESKTVMAFLLSVKNEVFE